jgi:hypothetical protein
VFGEGAGALGATAWPAIRWDRLVDNAAETKTGRSFVMDPRNREAFGNADGKYQVFRTLPARRRNHFQPNFRVQEMYYGIAEHHIVRRRRSVIELVGNNSIYKIDKWFSPPAFR